MIAQSSKDGKNNIIWQQMLIFRLYIILTGICLFIFFFLVNKHSAFQLINYVIIPLAVLVICQSIGSLILSMRTLPEPTKLRLCIAVFLGALIIVNVIMACGYANDTKELEDWYSMQVKKAIDLK